MYIKELSNKEFEQFRTSFNPSSIYQTIEYAFIMNNQQFDSIFLGLVDDQNYIVAASLFLVEKNTKTKYAYSPKGYLIDYNNLELLKQFTIELKKYFKKKNILAIKINPMIIKNIYNIKTNTMNENKNYNKIFNELKTLGYKHLGYNNFFESIKPRYVAVIDLNKPYYEIFNNIKKEYKTKIRSAEKNGIEVYKGHIEELNYLYLETKKKYPRDLKYFEDCYKFFSKTNKIEFFYTKLNTQKYLKLVQQEYNDQAVKVMHLTKEISENKNNRTSLINLKIDYDNKLLQLKSKLIYATNLLSKNPNGIITSSVLIVKDKDSVTLLMDGYNLKYKKFNSKHLLIWKLCEKYSNEGFKKFNIGGLTTLNLKDNPYQGLNDFKTNFNPNIIEYIGDLELVTNQALYLLNKTAIPIPNILKR